MKRSGVWPQLVIGWLPVGALYAALILAAHPRSSVHDAFFSAFGAIGAAALLAVPVQRLVARVPWPRPVTVPFVGLHIAAAPVFAISWLLLTSLIESVASWRFFILVAPPGGGGPFLILGVWFYIMIAGISYAARATQRAAEAEAAASKAQLAALRGQLNPHFLFNVLHTIVQQIPRHPERAAQAAEELAGLLRTTLQGDRDLVTLEDEVAFVERYLALERARFGDRLVVELALSPQAMAVLVPSFALQTLVENAIRHGAAPKVGTTEIAITAQVEHGRLTVAVRDSGVGASAAQLADATGTGLRRLRERLAVLYAGAARVDVVSVPGSGFTATLAVPAEPPDAA